MEQSCILIVDDEELNLYFLREVLSEYNFQILEATDGQKAVKACKDNQNIKLILMDIKMPVMNGFEATEIIKSKYPDIKIVAQTAYTFAHNEENAKSAGCDDYLIKPISIDSLNRIFSKYKLV